MRNSDAGDRLCRSSPVLRKAVRIPVEFSFDTDEVTIERRGDALILRPRYRKGWERFFADPDLRLPEEFQVPEDPPPQERDSL